ncbi:MAG TPA: membrane protein insertase YidC [Thermoanaerobaculia bacterium]|nr:membrane protein insertase YidC [Thermoanaerobaculia bacterium]
MDDRRLLLFFLISLVILVGWQVLVPPPPPPPMPVEEAAGEAPAPRPGERAAEAIEAPPAATPPTATLPPLAAEREEAVQVSAPGVRAELTNRGGQLRSYLLREHRDEEGEPLDLVQRRRKDGPWPLALLGPDLEPLAINDAFFQVRRHTDEAGHPVVLFEYRGPEGAARKQLRFLDGGLLELEVAHDAAGWGLLLGPGIRNPTAKERGGQFSGRQAVYRLGGEVDEVAAQKVDEALVLPGGGLAWVGLEDTYFLTALRPEEAVAEAVIQPVVVREGAEGPPELLPFASEAELEGALEDLPRDLRLVVRPQGEALRATVYLGAKEYERLAALEWGLERTVEWGMFGFLARPLLLGLNWIHQHMVANYGWAIVLMTVLLKILLFPLTHKSHVSMQKMQVLQPRMQAIRQKYRGKLRDKQGRMNLEAQRKMNEEIQELFRQEGASPYGGCLPILIQMPIFFAFFRLLLTAVELRHEPWVLWVRDLSTPDPIYLLPILMGATQIYQQRLTPMAADPMQRRIVQLFPWIFTVFAFSFPSGLVLYWTVNNVLTIIQTVLYNRWKKARESAGEPAGKGPPAARKKRGAGA